MGSIYTRCQLAPSGNEASKLESDAKDNAKRLKMLCTRRRGRTSSGPRPYTGIIFTTPDTPPPDNLCNLYYDNFYYTVT